MKPFLKWVGGKQHTQKSIRSYFPTHNITDYYEAFVGAGGVFLGDPYQYPNNHLNDLHPHLINAWKVVIEEPEGLKLFLETCFTEKGNTAQDYYFNRSCFNEDTEDGMSTILHATLFIYLNKHCFNGLCRYNSKGKFNVPFGKYKKVTIPEIPVFEINENWQVNFYNADFSDFFNNFEFSDTSLIYCDPPYIKEKQQSFTGYGTGWTAQDDVRLMEHLRELAKTKAHIFCSNSYCQRTLDLYKGCEFNIIPTRRDVAAKPDKRKASFDYLIKIKP